MKRSIVSSVISALSLMFVAIPASAQSSISNTGPGSTNQITSTSTTSLVCAQTNVATVLNSNAQASSSGAAATSNNTTAGSATSGSSANANNTATALNQQNSCLPGAQQAVANPNPEGGKGADVSAEPASTQVATLPNTGPVSPVEMTARASALLSGLAIAAYLGRDWMLRRQS